MAETPLMKQYKEIKSKYEDCILFFRLGDFYEMFFDDAIKASKELGLTLTSRNKEKGENVPLAGIPYHTANPYISKLVSKGYKVAICEQVEDPKTVKGIVKREVIKIITPGTVIDVETLDDKSNNYLAAIRIIENMIGIAYLDITTGEFKVVEVEVDNEYINLFNELNKIEPREILITNSFYENVKDKIDDFIQKMDGVITPIQVIRDSEEMLLNYFNIISLESFGIKNKKAIIGAAAMALDYAISMQLDGELIIEKIEFINNKNFADINLITKKNLELLKNQREKTTYGSLLWVLDKCKSSMGTRLLKRYINNPLLDIHEIKKRQNDVEYFINNVLIREEIKEKLENVYDLERLVAKIIFGNENGKDLIALKNTVKSSVEIIYILKENNFFNDINLESLLDIYKLIEKSILEDAPFSVREGGMIKTGYNSELDEIHKIMNNGKDYLLEIEAREKETTGIKNMKIKYNKVFGYFIEQTLSNAERFITPELKKYEDTIINSKARIEEIEYYLFKEISSKIKEEKSLLIKLAEKLAYIDVIISFSTIAVENDYVKPEINKNFDLEIINGRHPVVEKLIGKSDFASNNTLITENERFIVLTGPNMSGKSTYMKQIALISIMAQIGSYVPATEAKLPIVDKYLTRIGASDDILSGQSTFMVEMSEVSNILNNATENSLIILDEVGRGTSTFDGVSIATAISEYIHEKIKAKTIFATHYHELTDLEKKYKNVVNYRIEVNEKNGKVMFLRNIVKGGADKSYGIEVAKLAGLPKEILKQSKKILNRLEQKKELIEKTINVQQLSLFDQLLEIEDEDTEIVDETNDEIVKEIIYELENKDVNNMTPMDAMKFVFELKNKLREKM